jgi:hypothetical protein
MSSTRRRIVAATVASLLLATSAPAQTGDWQAVEKLKPGTLIYVKAQKRHACYFKSATPDELVCNEPRLVWHSRKKIPRAEIREVRVEPDSGKHARAGAGIGAGAGAAAGGAVGAVAGVPIGIVAGSMASIFRRGKVIYKQ